MTLMDRLPSTWMGAMRHYGYEVISAFRQNVAELLERSELTPAEHADALARHTTIGEKNGAEHRFRDNGVPTRPERSTFYWRLCELAGFDRAYEEPTANTLLSASAGKVPGIVFAKRVADTLDVGLDWLCTRPLAGAHVLDLDRRLRRLHRRDPDEADALADLLLYLAERCGWAKQRDPALAAALTSQIRDFLFYLPQREEMQAQLIERYRQRQAETEQLPTSE